MLNIYLKTFLFCPLSFLSATFLAWVILFVLKLLKICFHLQYLHVLVYDRYPFKYLIGKVSS